MVNVLKVVGKLADGDPQGPLVSLAQGACLQERDAFAECRDCFSVCPENAITPGKPPTLDVEACGSCLACLPICPVGAFTSSDAVSDLLQCAAYLDVQHAELLCAKSAGRQTVAHGPPGAVAIEVRGCLAGLGVGGYLALTAQGVKQVDARTEACAECPWAGLFRQIENQVAQAQAWLSIWERPETVKLVREADEDWADRPVYKASAPPISRRDLLRGLSRRNPVKDPLSVAEGNQPFRERLRLLLSLQQWPVPTGVNEKGRILPEAAGFSLLTVDDRCSACGTCTRACPVGALELETEDGRFRLSFAPKACVGCDICAHLCPEQAIAVNHTPRIGEVFGEGEILQLHTGRFSRCERCHSPFVPADPASKLCSLCEFRRQNPFGARTPPALLRRQQRTHTSQDRE